ncbi:MAG: hypothetical protein KJP21_09205 [Bacteroidia bacterium]|nr:hypothetical protein [Bacteroidia bacterium]NNJ55546.1 hypothetical protein [Bacteroidia bacterium]
MNRLAILFLISIFYFESIAVQPPVNNASALGLGGASATYNNPFAIENNVGILAFNENGVSFNGQNRYGLSEYSQLSLCGTMSINNTTLGIAYHNSPLADLSIQKYQLAIAKKLMDDLSVGIALNYHQHSSTNSYYKRGDAFSFNLGMYYQVNDKLNFGFQAFNPNRSKIIDLPLERLDAMYRLGTDYLLSENITLYSDLVQSTSQNLSFHGGLEVQKNQFKVRGGFNTNQEIALGLGYEKNQFSFDVGTSYHNVLGVSPSINLNYAF